MHDTAALDAAFSIKSVRLQSNTFHAFRIGSPMVEGR